MLGHEEIRTKSQYDNRKGSWVKPTAVGGVVLKGGGSRPGWCCQGVAKVVLPKGLGFNYRPRVAGSPDHRRFSLSLPLLHSLTLFLKKSIEKKYILG